MTPGAAVLFRAAQERYSVDADVGFDAGGGGNGGIPASATSDPASPNGTGFCQESCLDAGHCCLGSISACQQPSCAMGCKGFGILLGHISRAPQPCTAPHAPGAMLYSTQGVCRMEC